MDSPQSLLSQIILWHRDAQYEPIVQILELSIETGRYKDFEQSMSSTKELATLHTKASLYTYFGDSLYKLRYFRRALRAFEQALSFNDGSRRASKRFKTNNSLNNNCDISKINSYTLSNNENELKHRIHQCHLELHEMKEARSILERIPFSERSVKILASLADLYCREKNVEKAKETFLEILKQDPLRLDCVIKLCKLSGCEANMLLDILPDDVKRNHSWYPSWIQAQCYLHSSNSKQAIRLLDTLTSKFEKKTPLLTSLAQAHYHDGNFREAIRIFQQAYNNDPLTLAGVDCYAACLHKESSKRVLEELAVSMSSKCQIEGEHFHEPWLALAHYYASIDKKEPKALLFVQKAYKLNRSSVEALVLLACLSLEKKDGAAKATPYIMTAQTQAPYRYEVQRVLCDTFLANNKKPAALNFAKAAIQSLGQSARSYYLWADVMIKSQDQRRKSSARNWLEKAVKLDITYLPAVFGLTEFLIEDKKYNEALDILNAALPYHSLNSELHQHLYTCYNEKKDTDKALYHKNLASDYSTTYKSSNNEHLHRGPQDAVVVHDEPVLGLEADELVDHGDSEDEVNML